MRVLLRRGAESGPLTLRALDLTLDLKTRKVTQAGKPVTLSAKEFGVLEYLLRHPDEVVTRTQLAEHVWDENFDSFSNVIDVTVYHLREKVDRGLRACAHPHRAWRRLRVEGDERGKAVRWT